MSAVPQAAPISRDYATSAFVFSITRAIFVGYLYRDVSLHFYEIPILGGGWFFWTVLFGIFFLTISFVPKPQWGYCLNPIILTAIIWLLYYFGMSFSGTIRMHVKDAVTFAIGSFGGPIWIMVVTWVWHFIVCFRMFTDEMETA